MWLLMFMSKIFKIILFILVYLFILIKYLKLIIMIFFFE